MKRRDIILIADEPWENFTWRRRHHVAWALAKENAVLFVEPPRTFLSPLKEKNRRWSRLFTMGRLKNQGRNMFSYSPVKILPLSLPFARWSKFDALNRKSVFAQIRRCIRKLNLEKPILWVFFSERQYNYHGLFGEVVSVGDLYDNFTAPTWEGVPPAHLERLRQMQETILQESDIVFTVSRALYDELSPRHERVYLMPNGVDYESFEAAGGRPPDRAIEVRLKRPVIGFLGMMHYKVDFELLEHVARSNPGWTLLLMGKDNVHVQSDRMIFERLKKERNVVWTGELDRAAIPSFLSCIDVGIVPMKKIEMNRYSDFLKIWEYLAAGKPIVSVDQGVQCEYPDLIRRAGSKEEFVRQLLDALKNDECRETVKRRKEAAMANSWGVRVLKMLEIVDRFQPQAGRN